MNLESAIHFLEGTAIDRSDNTRYEFLGKGKLQIRDSSGNYRSGGYQVNEVDGEYVVSTLYGDFPKCKLVISAHLEIIATGETIPL